MKHIVQFSNGGGSTWVAWWVLQNFPKKDVILLNHDPGAEHPDSKRFQRQVSDFLNHPVTEVSHDKTLWELMEHWKAIPDYFMPFCTQELKLKQAENFFKALDEEFIIYNGFGVDEWQRVQRATMREESKGRVVKSPLFEIKQGGNGLRMLSETNGKSVCLSLINTYHIITVSLVLKAVKDTFSR